MEERELVIVGAGPGGYVAAIKAAQLGLQVTVVERAEVGGTCLNRGCIPTKSILHSAEVFASAREAQLFGVRIEGAAVDFEAVRTRAQDVVTQLRGGVEALFDANGIELVRGEAIVEPGPCVRVRTEEGERAFAARDVVIATGSAPALPPIEGLAGERVLTSDTLLAQVPAAGRLAVIGGGVIGMEFACAYAQMGTEVTVLEYLPRILPTLDRELGQSLALAFKKAGGTVATSALVQRVVSGEDGVTVEYELKGEARAVQADYVLVATGRSCDATAVCGAGLELACERGRIVVDERMRTSVEHVYAIGDITAGSIQLAHAASAQGIVAVSAIAGAPCEVNLEVIPSCVYTSPEIASVGMTEAEAKEAGIAVQTGKYVMSSNGKTLIGNLDRGFMKIVADEEGRVLGAQLLCGRATDIIGELAVAVANGLTVEQMSSVVRAHPTFEEGVGEAFEALLGGSIHSMPRKKRR